jgi:hypothetical protein
MKCTYCGKRIKTRESLLGGKLVEWHKPKRGVKLPYPFGMMKEFCGASGQVLPTQQNPHAL